MRHQSNLVLNQGLELISKQKQNKKTHKQIKKKQNKTSKKNDYAHYDFPGYSKCGKNIL